MWPSAVRGSKVNAIAHPCAQYVRVGDEGSEITFSFCPTCGATVCYVVEGREDSVAIPVGAFAEPGFPGPTFSVYEERKHAWVGLPPDIEHMA
jgi:hypothetical protein